MSIPRTALVTGAAKRIGRTIALDLAKNGWAVAVHYGRSRDAAIATVDDIRKAGGTAVALQADLSNWKPHRLWRKPSMHLVPSDAL
jgi:NAD(P)-dependent dehydrogenase (short-subunit alcohol dehydrogenase family)